MEVLTLLADLTSGYDRVASLQIYQLILETKNQNQTNKKNQKTTSQQERYRIFPEKSEEPNVFWWAKENRVNVYLGGVRCALVFGFFSFLDYKINFLSNFLPSSEAFHLKMSKAHFSWPLYQPSLVA